MSATKAAATNSLQSASLSTGKVDRVTKLIQDIRGQKDVTAMVHEVEAIGPPAVSALTQLLRDGTKIERSNAMYLLGRVNVYPAEAVPVIENMLDEKGADRVHIAIDLLRINPDSDKAMNVLVNEMKRGDTPTRIIIARMLSLNPNASKHVDVLIDMMSDKESDVRSAVAETLGEIGLKDKTAGAVMVPALIMALDDSSPWVRCQSARALGLIGAPAISAIPVLQRKTEDKSDRVKNAATVALALINSAVKQKPSSNKVQKKIRK